MAEKRVQKKRSSSFGGRSKKKVKRALVVFDYKESEALSRFITEKGKILPRRITKLSAKDQRELKRLIKRSRHAGLLPFQVA